jgi:hypothetical protein
MRPQQTTSKDEVAVAMTPTELVQNEIARFLSTTAPEVLCITGEWGIGKTFTWQRMLDQAVASKRLGLTRYAYVSLFGIESLDGLKLAIFENSEFVLPGEAEDAKSRAKKGGNWLIEKFHWLRPVAGELPWVGDVIKATGPLFFSLVRSQIICIDDLERRGADLPVRDVLGLVSFLKEQRKCKLVLLLNDRELDADGSKELEHYFEKVVDVALKFAPGPDDSVRIALPDTDTASRMIGENCKVLGIANIRVIKKIERFVRIIQPLVEEFDEGVFRQAAHSLTLLGWSKYQPKSAPPLDYLKVKKGMDYFGLQKAKDVPAEEAAWNALLDTYGFTVMDEFDLALLNSIGQGFFDPEAIRKHAAELEKKIKGEQQNGSFEEAWRGYHDSFADNKEEVLNTIDRSFKSNVHTISPLNLNGTVSLFKDLGRADQARELIRYYIEERKEERDFWDLDNNVFFGDVRDPDVAKAFRDKLESFNVDLDPVDLLLKIARDNWSDRDIAALASLPSDEYFRIFKSHTGRELSKIISAALQFDRIVNATAPMREISSKARQALRQIGSESAINARRVEKFGVDIGEDKISRTPLTAEFDEA